MQFASNHPKEGEFAIITSDNRIAAETFAQQTETCQAYFFKQGDCNDKTKLAKNYLFFNILWKMEIKIVG